MMDKRKKIKRSNFSSEESDNSSISSSITSSSSSDEETDAKDLKPIKEYLSNRKELASQLFKSVKAEKIRMMLPQILKKIEFSDLEELCANELTGMSKARIMSILNGQEMLQSSNTEDSDDSGPSLEIVSDTEWLSDDKSSIKVEGAKLKKNSKKLKKLNSKFKSKLNEKGKNGKLSSKVKVEKVKIEGKNKAKEKPKEKEKEGESLLDLLELEMRARAIKALLRKEDELPATSLEGLKNQASGSGILSNVSVQARQANLKEQLEKIDVLMKHGDDEDVYVVINPAPTIELLSSDDEKENQSKKSRDHPSPSKVAQNGERVEVKERTTVLNKLMNVDKNTNENPQVNIKKGKDAKGKEKGKHNGNSNLPMSVIESNNDDKVESPKEPLKEEELEEGEIIDNEDDEKEQKKVLKADVESLMKEKIKKIKKNPNIRSKKSCKQSDSDSDNGIVTKEMPEAENIEVKKKETVVEPIEIKDSPERKASNDPGSRSRRNSNTSSQLDVDDDKALDIEEIINLDDYPDDMDEPEKPKSLEPQIKQLEQSTAGSKSETWASRYVQQDEVQSVIRESKIQSEIRKRLRERQRQSKFNNSSKESEISTPEPITVLTTTGSVEEYLALKRHAEGDLTADESLSQGKTDVTIDSSVVIVKKPQLILSLKVKEQQIEELVVNTKEEQTLDTNVVKKCENTPERTIVIKEDSSLKDKRVVLVRPKDDLNSDSSDDNVTVKINNSSWNDSQHSELRSD
ncbi:FK506-binding protein 5 [Phymastichus coffea]|uniref:FK506-binding protein 5 n=1 Tax=Phymastichus coffea TaxID=108790 RepID=UPI00273C45A3|nr:FK506-binding protein 5 [Phymastichus coffea]